MTAMALALTSHITMDRATSTGSLHITVATVVMGRRSVTPILNRADMNPESAHLTSMLAVPAQQTDLPQRTRV